MAGPLEQTLGVAELGIGGCLRFTALAADFIRRMVNVGCGMPNAVGFPFMSTQSQMDLFHCRSTVTFVIVISFSEGRQSFMQQSGGITGTGRIDGSGGSGLNAICQSNGQHDGCKQGCEPEKP